MNLNFYLYVDFNNLCYLDLNVQLISILIMIDVSIKFFMIFEYVNNEGMKV